MSILCCSLTHGRGLYKSCDPNHPWDDCIFTYIYHRNQPNVYRYVYHDHGMVDELRLTKV